MAEREAAIKLTLEDGQFVAAMGKAGDAAVRNAQRSERAMQVFGAGVKQATSNLQSLGSMARSSLGLVSGLLGGLTVGNALKGAVELDAKFKQLAFRVGVATRAQVKHTELQRLAEQAAAKTGRRTAEMADAYEQLFSATGDREFTDNMLETIGEAATATGQEISTLTSLADQLHTKFGVAADGIGDAFAQVFDAAQRGGPSFQEFTDVVSGVGAELLAAGLEGQRGLDFMLGSLVATDDRFKNLPKQVAGLKAVLRGLSDSSELKKLAARLALDPKKLINEKDALARLRTILSKGQKGMAALSATMRPGEEKETLDILFLDPFKAALDEAGKAGLKGRAKIDAALAAFDQQIGEFGKSTLTGAHLQDEAQKRMNDPQRRLERALETLQASFSDPKIIDAIDQLSKYLPDIASAFGKFAQFVVKNPVLAGTLGVAGSAGSGFLEGVVSEALGDAFKQAFGGGGGKGGGKGGGGGGFERSAANKRLLDAGLTEAQIMGGLFETGIEKGGEKAGSKIAAAMQLASIAAAAALAVAIGKEQIDKISNDLGEAQGGAEAAFAQGASRSGSISKNKAEAQAMRKQLEKLREESGGIGGFFMGLFEAMSRPAGGGGMAGAGGGMMSPEARAALNRGAAASTPDSLSEHNAKRIEEMEQALKEKEAFIAKLESDEKQRKADSDAVGKATADALKAGAPVRVMVVNPSSPGAPPAGNAGPGGSRGVKRPAAQAPGGGY